MANFVLVHGFNVRDGGKNTVDKCEKALVKRGHTVDKDSADYGWHYLFAVRFNHKRDVKRIAKALVSADVVITHSNGANYVNKALKLIAKSHPLFRIDVIHFSPAIDSDADIPRAVNKMILLATPHDNAVKWADKLWFHSWGNAGRVGYTGGDERGKTLMRPAVKGHSEWFKQAAKYVNQALKEL